MSTPDKRSRLSGYVERWAMQNLSSREIAELKDELTVVFKALEAAPVSAIGAPSEPTSAMIQAACDATFGKVLSPEEAHRLGWIAMASKLMSPKKCIGRWVDATRCWDCDRGCHVVCEARSDGKGDTNAG